jgi:hypothetical protein
VSEPNPDPAELQRQIAQNEAMLARDRERIAKLTLELEKAPAAAADETFAAQRAVRSFVGILCAAAVVLVGYFGACQPKDEFTPDVEKGLRSQLQEVQKERDRLERVTPSFLQQGTERANRAVPSIDPVSTDDYVCLSQPMKEAQLEQVDDVVGLRWAQIGMAACRTRQAGLIATSFDVLSSSEGAGANADARKKLFRIVYGYCVQHGVSPLGATAARSLGRLQRSMR